MAIRQRSGIPGGACEFDLPSYHYWLHQDAAYRRTDIAKWAAPFFPLRDGVSIVLRLLRESGKSSGAVANHGMFQQMMGGKLAQMLRVGVDEDISKLMDVAIGALAGRPLDEINEIGEELFRKKIAGMIYPDARALLAAHVEKGHTLVIASSATPPQIELSDGTLTGRIDGDIRWGPGKAAAVTEFAAEHEIDLAESFAYANGTEDLEFLAAVGRPRPLNPEEGLTILAEERGWPTNKLFRPKQIGPTEVVRSALAYGSLGFGFGVGAVTAAVNGSRRSGANLAAAVGSDLALAAGGIQLNVIGQENLWAAATPPR